MFKNYSAERDPECKCSFQMCIALSLPFGSDMEVAQNPPPVVISCLRSSMQARESMDQPLLNVVHLSLTSGFTLITQSNNTAKKRNKTNWASYYSSFRVSLVAHSVKNLPAVQETTCSAEDPGSICGSGRSPGEGSVNPLHYSCPENPVDRGAWRAPVHRVAKSQT